MKMVTFKYLFLKSPDDIRIYPVNVVVPVFIASKEEIFTVG